MKNTFMRGFYALVAAVICAACVASSASDITVTDAWARPSAVKPVPTADSSKEMTNTIAMADTSMNGPVSAIYMVITNKGGTADKLISASTDVSEVTEIHETKQMANGMMGMQPVQGGLDIPANGSVTLKPGSYHIMLMKLRKDLMPGANVKLTIKFQSGKELSLDVPIKAMK